MTTAATEKHWPESVRKFLATTFLIVTRALCPFCLILAGLSFYDLTMPATTTDTAIVTGKTSAYEGRGGRAYRVQAKGRFNYNERITRSLYGLIQQGDGLQIRMSRFFSEWKTVSVVRYGVTIDTRQPRGLLYMGLMAGWFLLSTAAFLPPRVLFSYRILTSKTKLLRRPVRQYSILPIMVATTDFVALAMWYRLIGVWMGHFDKF